MKPRPRSAAGMTMVEFLVVTAVLIVLAGMVLPAIGHRPRPAKRNQCVNNLKIVGLAFRVFGNDNDDKFPGAVSPEKGGARGATEAWRLYLPMSNELSTPFILVCPKDDRPNAHDFAAFGPSNLSYFASVSAEAEIPQALLAGDRNLELAGHPLKPGPHALRTNLPLNWGPGIHQRVGQVALADGSVQQFNDKRLREQLRAQGLATNLILLP